MIYRWYNIKDENFIYARYLRRFGGQPASIEMRSFETIILCLPTPILFMRYCQKHAENGHGSVYLIIIKKKNARSK